MVYLVIGEYCWGRGKTEEEATENARKAGTKQAIKNRLVYTCNDDECGVDTDGMLVWHHRPDADPHHADLENKPILIKRIRGKKIEVVPM